MAKKSIRQIAKELKRCPSSIAREINKNRDSLERIRYNPRIAHEKAIINRSHRGRRLRLKSDLLRQYVKDHLRLGWSPEQIAATAPEKISHEAIYQYIYAQVYRNGWDLLRPGCEDLRPYLARRRKRRLKQGLRSSYRIDLGILPSIDNRPRVVDLRERVGHWEDDLIVSKQSRDGLKTINERATGLVLIEKV